MSESNSFFIEFTGLSTGEASQAAEQLRAALASLKEADSVEPVRTDDRHQDFGASLALVLGAPAAIAIAKGIANWLVNREKGEVIIKTANGSVVARGAAAARLDVNQLAKTLRGGKA